MTDRPTITRRNTLLGATPLAAAAALGAQVSAVLQPAAAQTSAPAQGNSPQDLMRRSIERRATEAAISGMPAVNYDLMRQEMLTKTAGKENEIR